VSTFKVLLGHEGEESEAPLQDKSATQAQIPVANEKPRLIVLPFSNLNNVEDNDFLVDGIVEDIIMEFSRLNSIEVISRTTAFSFKGKEINNAQIASEFGIDFIANGSIRSSGNRIRISVELTNPTTGSSIWSERYDRTMDDVFEVQDEIVRKIMVALVGKLETASLDRAKRKPTESLTSYEYLLRGRDFHHKFSKEGVLSAIEMLDKSIGADPENGQAYAWKACSIGQGLGNGYLEGDMQTHFDEAKSMIQKALELDENDFECHRLLCEINKFFEDFEQSEFYGKKAYDMNPNDSRIVSGYGELLVLIGRAEEGTDLLIKAYELDPAGLGASNADKRLGDVMLGAYVKGDFQQCLEYDKKVGKKNPIAWAAKIASLESMNQSQAKEVELKKFADTHNDLVLEEEIDKLHFQDASVKQTLKDLVA
jgi:TolB-like protein/Tfp pilus assembly protein PilF